MEILVENTILTGSLPFQSWPTVKIVFSTNISIKSYLYHLIEYKVVFKNIKYYFFKIQILTIAFRIRLDFSPRLSTFQDMTFQVPILGLLLCFPTSAFQTFPQRITLSTKKECWYCCFLQSGNSSPFVLLHVRFTTIFDVIQSSKCFALIFLFGLANLTKLSVGSAGTNPSTTLYIRIRRRLSVSRVTGQNAPTFLLLKKRHM